MSSNPFLYASEETITLPRTKAKVVMRAPTLDESFQMSEVNTLPLEQRTQRIKEFVFKLISSWDAKDKDGADVDVTIENFGYLPASDALVITKAAMLDVTGGVEGKDDAAPSA